LSGSGKSTRTRFTSRTLFSSRTIVVMNGTHLGDLDLGPRAHPDDGLLDVTDGRLRLADRLRAGTRMRTGSHLPHPDLTTSRSASFSATFARPAAVFVDGVGAGDVTELAVRCLPDALVVVV
jgi:diacylglycerol kinase family enzyme